MLRLAGEIADGVVLWLCIPEYIRDVVVPTVAEGRAKAGKPAEGFDDRGGGPVRGHGRHRAGQGAVARGADPVLLAALLPQDDRGLRVRRRPRRLRPARARTPSPTASSSRSPRSGARRRPRPRCAATPTAGRPRPPSAASPGRTSTPRSRPSPGRSAEPNERSGTCAFTFAPRWGVSPRDEEGSSGHRGLPRVGGRCSPPRQARSTSTRTRTAATRCATRARAATSCATHSATRPPPPRSPAPRRSACRPPRSGATCSTDPTAACPAPRRSTRSSRSRRPARAATGR